MASIATEYANSICGTISGNKPTGSTAISIYPVCHILPIGGNERSIDGFPRNKSLTCQLILFSIDSSIVFTNIYAFTHHGFTCTGR